MSHSTNACFLIVVTAILCLLSHVSGTFIEIPVQHHQKPGYHIHPPAKPTSSSLKHLLPPATFATLTNARKASSNTTSASILKSSTDAPLHPDIVSVFSSAHGLRRRYDQPVDHNNVSQTQRSRDADKSVFSLASSISIGDPIPKQPDQRHKAPINKTEKKQQKQTETTLHPPSTSSTTTSTTTTAPNVKGRISSTTASPPLPGAAKKSVNRMPAAGSLITAIALILANSLVNKTDLFTATFANRSSNAAPVSNFKGLGMNRTKALSHSTSDEDMATSESSLSISNTASSIANWLRNAILGNKWLRKNHRLPFDYNVDRTAGQMGIHSYPDGYQSMDTNVDPNMYPQQFIQSFVPAPDGFPGPFSGNSVLLPPEALQDTGIMYWLNFIEQAAQQQQQGNTITDDERGHDIPLRDRVVERPIKIGEKPPKTGPNSIKDELILDEGSEIDHDDVDPYERSKKTTRPANAAGPNKLPTSIQDKTQQQQSSPGAEMIATDATAPRCDKFTSSICVDDFEYPEQAIVDEIYKRRDIFELMYSGDGVSSKGSNLVDGIPKEQEEGYVYDNYDPRDRDRDNDGTHASGSMIHKSESIAGYVCPSEVLYGKPKLAKNLDNEWKVIVNAGEFTQTLRMEKCLKPNRPCNYIMPHFETRCAQVHSVHRLMVFEKGKGFFVESFKIPTGCNCQIIRVSPGISQDEIVQDMSNNPFDKPSISAPSLEEMLIAGPPLSFNPNQQAHSNRNRYKNTQHNSLMNALHGLHRPRPSFDHLQHHQEPAYHVLNRRPTDSSPPASYSNYPSSGSLSSLNNAINNMNQNGQLTNTLWSILMGGTADARLPVRSSPSQNSGPPDEHSIPPGLLSHLKQNYPQINPETFLQQLIGNQMQRQQQANDAMHQSQQQQSQQRPQQRLKQPMHNLMGPQTGSTTTIVNPLAHMQSGGGNQPLVQVIHVPVSSSMPSHVYKHPPPPASQMTAYDSRSNATIANNDTTFVAYDGYQTDEQSGDNKSPDTGGYLSSAKDTRYTVIEGNDNGGGTSSGASGTAAHGDSYPNEAGSQDYDEDQRYPPEPDPVSGSSSNASVMQEQQQGTRKQSNSQPHNESTVASGTSDEISNNSLTKRMLSQKINFNYHPILEYIPIESVNRFPDSSPRRQKTAFS